MLLAVLIHVHSPTWNTVTFAIKQQVKVFTCTLQGFFFTFTVPNENIHLTILVKSTSVIWLRFPSHFTVTWFPPRHAQAIVLVLAKGEVIWNNTYCLLLSRPNYLQRIATTHYQWEGHMRWCNHIYLPCDIMHYSGIWRQITVHQ